MGDTRCPPIWIHDPCVIVSQDQWIENKALRSRAEDKLRQLEEEQAKGLPNDERDSYIKCLKWLLGKGL